ncbi:MAG: glycosyltransferase [Pseudomonadota bacterium]
MRTILHSIDTGGPGGAETVFKTLAGTARDGVRNIALAKPGGWVEQALADAGIESYFCNPQGSFNRTYLRSIIDLIRKHRVSLVQSHLFGSNLYCALAGRLCGVPVVSAFHGAQDLSSPGLASGIKRQLVQRGAHAIIAVSKTLRDELLAAGFRDSEKLQVIYNGIDVARFRNATASDIRAQLGIPDEATLVGAVGNVRSPKGYEVLVSALAALRSAGKDIHVVIAGQGSGRLLDELTRTVADHGLADRIHLPGFIDDTPGFFQAIDVYVSSSHSEGFSLSCVEAMASCTPVVATRSGGPEEIFSHEATGLLVPVRDPAALAAAIQGTLTDKQATQARIEAAYHAASTRFSVEAMVDGYHGIYNAVLNGTG